MCENLNAICMNGKTINWGVKELSNFGKLHPKDVPRMAEVASEGSARECQHNMVERLHRTIRQRNKVMRLLDDVETAQTMMDGLRIYYNFIRPHTALNGKTPTQKVDIETDKARQNGCL